jgi:ubiquinone/menaquinone biosynthesis C-methylase UbiE
MTHFSRRPDESGDYYERMLSSGGYIASRAQKSELIGDICRELLANASRIVDLGCGTGLILRRLEERFSKKIIGVEIDSSCLKTKEGIVVANLESLPFTGGSFDFAVCNHVFEHITDKGKFLSEVRRILRTGGSMYFTAGNKFQFLEPHYRLPFLSWLPKDLADRYLRSSGRGREYRGIRYVDYWTLKRMAEEAGFEVEDLTREVMASKRDRLKTPILRAAAALFSWIPGVIARPVLKICSPHWFFFLRADRPRIR